MTPYRPVVTFERRQLPRPYREQFDHQVPPRHHPPRHPREQPGRRNQRTGPEPLRCDSAAKAEALRLNLEYRAAHDGVGPTG